MKRAKGACQRLAKESRIRDAPRRCRPAARHARGQPTGEVAARGPPRVGSRTATVDPSNAARGVERGWRATPGIPPDASMFPATAHSHDPRPRRAPSPEFEFGVSKFHFDLNRRARKLGKSFERLPGKSVSGVPKAFSRNVFANTDPSFPLQNTHPSATRAGRRESLAFYVLLLHPIPIDLVRDRTIDPSIVRSTLKGRSIDPFPIETRGEAVQTAIQTRPAPFGSSPRAPPRASPPTPSSARGASANHEAQRARAFRGSLTA